MDSCERANSTTVDDSDDGLCIIDIILLFFFYFVHRLILNEARRFGSRLCLLIQARKTHNLVEPLDRSVINHWVQ